VVLNADPIASIVIAADTTADAVGGCLAAIEATAAAVPHEVILVDAGAGEIAETAFETVGHLFHATVVVNHEGTGPLLAANQGAELAAGRVIVVLSPAARVRPGWLEALLDVLDRDSSVGVVGPKLLGPSGLVDAAGWLVHDDGQAVPFGRGFVPDSPVVTSSCSVDAVSRMCLAVRTATWRGLGGFDARYAPTGYEDVDLCFAARAISWDVRYAAAAEVMIGEPSTGDLAEAQRRRFAARWRGVLAHQEPSPDRGGPDILTADRAARAVELPKRGDPTPRTAPRSDTVLVVAPEPAALSRSEADRMTSIRAALTDGGRHVVARTTGGRAWPDDDHAVAARHRVLTGEPGVVWLAGRDALEGAIALTRRAHPAAILVADLVALETTAQRRRALLGEPGADEAAARAETAERWLLRLADVVVTTTQADADLAAELVPGADVHVVPLAADPGPCARRVGRTGVVVAVDETRGADLDAARWLQREVMPRARLAIPDLVAGVLADPAAALRAIVGAGVQLLPPTAATTELARAAVALAPWRFGSGLQPWVLRAMAAGVPVVMTPVAAEGLGLCSDQAVIGRSADELAREIIDLLADPDRWAAVSAAGQDHVRTRRFTSHGLAERLRSLTDGLLAPV